MNASEGECVSVCVWLKCRSWKGKRKRGAMKY